MFKENWARECSEHAISSHTCDVILYIDWVFRVNVLVGGWGEAAFIQDVKCVLKVLSCLVQCECRKQTRPYLWDRRLCCLLFSVFPHFCSSDFTWIFLMRTELRIMTRKKRQEGRDSVVNVRHIEHATRPDRDCSLPDYFFFFHVCTLKCLTSNKYLNFSQTQHKSTPNAVFKQRFLLLSGGKEIQAYATLSEVGKKWLPSQPNHCLGHPEHQQLQIMRLQLLQWVSNSAVEEFISAELL